ncbi:MAG: glycosyltransferase [Pseudomonadales bacterium]|nr:glycosyltransferase [Pseudomonadales bacterium]
MKYSIIIPCFNEAHVLSDTLSSVRQAMGGRNDVEIILMDNGSSDASQSIAASFGVMVCEDIGVKISGLRNLGARKAIGTYFLFLDADIVVANNWFEQLDRFTDIKNDDYTADVVGFVDDVPSHAPWYARIWGLRASARRNKLMEIDSLPGRNLFVSKKWFEVVGGFNENLTTGEDKDFVMRLRKSGALVLSDPRLAMIHMGYERTFREWSRKEYWRQHSHIGLMQHQGISIRLLRFPLICVVHLLLVVAFMIALITCDPSVSLSILILSLLPSFLLSLKKPLSRFPLDRLFQFTFLYWLRFHIAGWSVLKELREIIQLQSSEV